VVLVDDGDIFWETCCTVADRCGDGSQYKTTKVETINHLNQLMAQGKKI